MDSAIPSTSRRCRLSLSKKFSDTGEDTAVKSTGSSKSMQDSTSEIMQILSQNPFRITGRTLSEEHDILSQAPDAVSVSSKEVDTKSNIMGLQSVISVSSGSDREASPTPKKSTIQEFFTPKDSKVSVLGASTPNVRTTRKSSSRKENFSCSADPKKVKKVRRQICKSSNIKMLTNKYFDDSQKRITSFFSKTDEDPDRVGYHRVLKSSVMPAINTGDENMEKFLSVDIKVGSQPLNESQIQGPSMESVSDDPGKIMERIEKAQSALYDRKVEDWNMELNVMPITVNSPAMEEAVDSGFSEIKTPGQQRTKTSASMKRKSVPAKSTSKKARPAKTPATVRKRKIVCPQYKVIAGTNFAVDAFRYGDIEGVSHYFLTHYHADHYIGLKKSFAMPLIMSPVTSRLVKAFINVSEEYYQLIELHETITIDDVRITALDANHCPGAVMFLFQLPTGTNILHTGDFRASADMEEYPEFWNVDINSLYLDTTYLSTKYAFKSQFESITDACDVVRRVLNRNIGARVLIVCGSYLIGKEKVWTELAVQFNFKVWTEPNRRKALAAINDKVQQQQLVDDPQMAEIHVLGMNKVSYDELIKHVEQFPDRYDLLIALRPSGWEKNSRPQYRGFINIIGVEYSEHSSVDELRRFVRFLRPQEVISTVPYGASNQNRTPQVPPSWYRGDIRPERQALQLSMTSFVQVGSKTSEPRKQPRTVAEKPTHKKDDDDCTIISSGSEELLVCMQSEKVIEEASPAETVHSEEGEQDDDSDSDWMP
ncbi:DNA cross-link repair 1A protein-like [Armigeres subalbatus]|uniref:DNA cross-link repair 1A protein-like n=1 Tax=Armigeres subalbatus TaxID=124917 RepID=UPI002ED18DD5